MEEKYLGKIESAYFGLGGYNDAMLGLHLSFSGKSWGTCTSDSTWDYEKIECSKYAKWTEENRTELMIKMLKNISKYLKEAKVNSIDKLKGIPVEVTFENNTIKSWRILTEVL